MQKALAGQRANDSDHAAMRVLEVAGLTTQGLQREAAESLEAFKAELASHDAGFRVGWAWNGTRHFIENSNDPGITKHRARLLALIDAMDGENRDAILVKLRNLP